MRSLILALALSVFALAGCRQAPDPAAVQEALMQASDPELLHASVKTLTDVMVYDIFSPPQASRAYAYASIAAYEAAILGDDTYRSLAGQLNEFEAVPPPPEGAEVHAPVAAVEALLVVAEAMVFSDERIAAYRERLRERYRAMGVPRGVLDASLAYGDAVAQHVLAWADGDNYRQTRGGTIYTVTHVPGSWRPTPPAYMEGIEPNWGTLRPFAMEHPGQFAPPPPVPFDMAPGSPFYRQVREVYDLTIGLTPEQREIAGFWDCNPYVVHLQGHAKFATKKLTPGGHWMGITAIANRQTGRDLAASAEAYAKASIALSDAFISSWEEKYRSNLVRPETVINEYLDEDWQPLLQTPPFPEYTSGHSVISGAVVEPLRALFGESFAFVDTTEVEYGLGTRSFASFHEAADEAARSRLYGGIHYPMAAENGLEQGRRVGDHLLRRVQTRRSALAAYDPTD